MSVRLVIVAALEREVMPLVKRWRVQGSSLGAYRTFEKDDVLVVCAGMGPRPAMKAVDNVLGMYKPDLLVSAGMAGAIDPDAKVGDVIIPATVVSSATGTRFSTGHGSGILVSVSGVAGQQAKRLLARQYDAQIVDMEAAAVAEVAAERGIPFLAVKAVSDEIEFVLPDMDPFIDPYGRFRTGKFIYHVAFRPALWSVLRKLKANSDYASKQLCAELLNLINESKRQPSGSEPHLVANVEREIRIR